MAKKAPNHYMALQPLSPRGMTGSLLTIISITTEGNTISLSMNPMVLLIGGVLTLICLALIAIIRS